MEYVNIDSKHSKYLGHRWQSERFLSGDLRCKLCGRWFSWSTQNVEKYVLEHRWNEERNEPEHCGSTHCQDYQMRYVRHLCKMHNDPDYYVEMQFKVKQRKETEREHAAYQLFNQLKSKGVIS